MLYNLCVNLTFSDFCICFVFLLGVLFKLFRYKKKATAGGKKHLFLWLDTAPDSET